MSLPIKWVSADIVSHFQAGLSMQELAERTGIPLLKIEQTIRRWMIKVMEEKQ